MSPRNAVVVALIVISAIFAADFARLAAAKEKEKPVISKSQFGTIEGKSVELYSMKNSHGVEVRAMNFGGIIVSLLVPDKNGKPGDVVLGYDKSEPYRENPAHFGGIIGRYANRIAGGKFTLDGVSYTLARNNGPNTLHGGIRGFDKVFWQAEPFEKAHDVGVVFTYLSNDGEEGFPGNLRTTVTYTLNDQNELIFEYEATTTKATPLNLTQHTYFNLAGEGSGDVLGHELMVSADRFTAVDKNLIPTGELRPVQGTPLDFTKPTAIGARIHDKYEQMVLANGYDHDFVVREKGDGLAFAARVREPRSGRILEVYTNQPGIQIYSGNFLDGTITGKHGHVYQQHCGLALETQHFPDSPNHPEFPSTILRPGETFHSRTMYKFSAKP